MDDAGAVRVPDVLGRGEAGSRVRGGLAHRSRLLHGEPDAVSGGLLENLLSSVVEFAVAHAAVYKGGERRGVGMSEVLMGG